MGGGWLLRGGLYPPTASSILVRPTIDRRNRIHLRNSVWPECLSYTEVGVGSNPAAGTIFARVAQRQSVWLPIRRPRFRNPLRAPFSEVTSGSLMSTSGNKRKSEFLGISFSTANYRLHRMLLFRMAKKAGDNDCFRCGKKITKLEEFTLDHKKQWLDVSEELFWSLSNVAFSHQTCNAGHTRNTIDRPKGKNWCFDCKSMLPVSMFYKNRRGKNGLAKECKPCKNIRQNEYRRRKRIT